MGESIPKEKVEELFEYFERETPEGKRYTMDQIAQSTGISAATVGRYKKQWDSKQRDSEQIQQAAVKEDPADLLEKNLRSMGVGDSKIEMVINILRSNPKLKESPQEIYQMLIEAVSLKPYFANLIMKGVFHTSNFQDAQAPQYPAQMPPPAPYPGMPPYGAPVPYGAPPPYPYPPPPYGVPPYWAPQAPPAPAPEGVSMSEVRAAIMDALSSREPAPEPLYEESLEPVMVNGVVIKAEDGQPLMRKVKRPLVSREQSIIHGMTELKHAGLLGGQDGQGDAIRGLQEEMRRRDQAEIDAMRQEIREMRAKPPEAPRDDKVVLMLEQVRAQQSDMSAKYEAEKVRREERDKFDKLLHEERQARFQAEMAAAAIPKSITGTDQVILKALEETKSVVKETQRNNQDRLDKLQQLAMAVVGPTMANLKPVPPTAGDWSALEKRQQAVDAAEKAQGAPNGAASTPEASMAALDALTKADVTPPSEPAPPPGASPEPTASEP